MTATPALTNDIFGKYQKKISDKLFLDTKQSEGVLTELQAFGAELSQLVAKNAYDRFFTNVDPGDENE